MKDGDVGKFFVWVGLYHQTYDPVIQELHLRFRVAPHESWYETLDGKHTYGDFVDQDRDKLIKRVTFSLERDAERTFDEFMWTLNTLNKFKKYNPVT